MKNTKKIFFILIFFILIPSFFCSAQTLDKNCPEGSSGVCLANPLGNATPQTFIGRIINAVLGVVGSLALLMFIYGGFTWMTAAGSSEKIEKGKGIIIWAVIGLAVIFTSYALVKFVFASLTTATT